MKALITGAYGFVGKHLADALLTAGHSVIATGREQNQESRFPVTVQHAYLDTQSLDSIKGVLLDIKPDVVYHLAGISFVPQAEKDFALALAVNVGGLHNVLSIISEVAPQTRCVTVSSPEIYRTPLADELPLKETHPFQARNNYGLTRECGEAVIKLFEQRIKGGLVVARPFTHFGPGQEEKFVVPAFAKQIAEIKNGKRKPEIHVGNLDAKRDFSDVADIIRAYVAMGTRGQGAYNLGSGKATEVRALLEGLLDLAGLSNEVAVVVDPARVRHNEMPEFYGDCSRAKADLGWEAKIPLNQTLKSVYDEWLAKTK